MNKFVYHGSPNGDIKIFEPRESTQKGAYVYATESFEIAGIFAVRADSLERDIKFFMNEKRLIVVERVENYFKNTDKTVYIYKFDSSDFSYFNEDNWSKLEVRSNKKVAPIEVVKFDSGIEMLKQFAKEGKIGFYAFAERGKAGVDENDFDMLDHVAKMYSMNPEKSQYVFGMAKTYYPNLKEGINYIEKSIVGKSNAQQREFAKDIYDYCKKKLRDDVAASLEKKETF